ncbi:MAG: hypothetical protein E4H10_10965 [Bacteroidia bacterium]|nr:MAG: hypothetical protein E4H10_10965 [Bacteroidia bacterium]
MKANKLRVIQDFEKVSTEIQEQIKLVYPEGFSQHLVTFTNKNNEIVYALPFETDEKIYMIRMSFKKAVQLIKDDTDYDDDGILKDDIREKYEDEHSDVEYLSENENYDDDF